MSIFSTALLELAGFGNEISWDLIINITYFQVISYFWHNKFHMTFLNHIIDDVSIFDIFQHILHDIFKWHYY